MRDKGIIYTIMIVLFTFTEVVMAKMLSLADNHKLSHHPDRLTSLLESIHKDGKQEREPVET